MFVRACVFAHALARSKCVSGYMYGGEVTQIEPQCIWLTLCSTCNLQSNLYISPSVLIYFNMLNYFNMH